MGAGSPVGRSDGPAVLAAVVRLGVFLAGLDAAARLVPDALGPPERPEAAFDPEPAGCAAEARAADDVFDAGFVDRAVPVRSVESSAGEDDFAVPGFPDFALRVLDAVVFADAFVRDTPVFEVPAFELPFDDLADVDLDAPWPELRVDADFVVRPVVFVRGFASAFGVEPARPVLPAAPADCSSGEDDEP